MNAAPDQVKERWGRVPLRAIPFFIPGWLWLPLLQFGIPWLPKDINENVLALVLQIPTLLAAVVIFPWVKGWITGTAIFTYLLLPNALFFMIYLAMMPD